MNQKNVKYLSLGTADLTIMASGTVISSYADVPVGQLAIVNSTNTTVTTDQTGTAPYLCRIVQRVGTDLVYSPFIDASKLVGVRATTGSLAVEQVSFVGYNGTSGLLADAVSSDYIIKGIIKNSKTTYNNTPFITHWPYKSGSSTSEAAVAKGLLDIFNSWNKRQPETLLKCERTVAVASTDEISDGGGSGVIFKVTNGLKAVIPYIKAADATSDLTVSTVTITDGDIVNFPTTNGKTFTFTAVALGSGAGRHLVKLGTTSYNVADAGTHEQNATAIAAAINAGTQATASASTTTVTITYINATANNLTPFVLSTDDDSTWANVAVAVATGDAVPVQYKVDGTTAAAASFDLDTIWQGETGYVYEGETSTTIGVTVATADTWGLKFTGVALPENAETRNYEKVRFELGLEGDFADTVLVTSSIKAADAVGSAGQLGIFERQAQMNDGQAWVDAYPSRQHRSEVAGMAGELFPLYQTVIDFYDDGYKPLLGDTPYSYATVVVATANATGHGLIGDVFGI